MIACTDSFRQIQGSISRLNNFKLSAWVNQLALSGKNQNSSEDHFKIYKYIQCQQWISCKFYRCSFKELRRWFRFFFIQKFWNIKPNLSDVLREKREQFRYFYFLSHECNWISNSFILFQLFFSYFLKEVMLVVRWMSGWTSELLLELRLSISLSLVSLSRWKQAYSWKWNSGDVRAKL